jgi:hypothetical protein
VARRSTKVNLDEGKVFVEEGSAGREFFVILEGRAEVTSAPGMTRKLLAGMAYRLRDLDTSRS